jgi:hypothetical protein
VCTIHARAARARLRSFARARARAMLYDLFKTVFNRYPMTLEQRLTGLSHDDQGALARKEAPSLPVPELLEALRVPNLGEWARLHITYELVHRGPSLVHDVGRALLAEPLGPTAPTLHDSLVELFRYEPSARAEVVKYLFDAGNVAFDQGGSSWDAGRYVDELRDCVFLLGAPIPEAVTLARRLLEVAAKEEDPAPMAIPTANKLIDGEYP